MIIHPVESGHRKFTQFTQFITLSLKKKSFQLDLSLLLSMFCSFTKSLVHMLPVLFASLPNHLPLLMMRPFPMATCVQAQHAFKSSSLNPLSKITHFLHFSNLSCAPLHKSLDTESKRIRESLNCPPVLVCSSSNNAHSWWTPTACITCSSLWGSRKSPLWVEPDLPTRLDRGGGGRACLESTQWWAFYLKISLWFGILLFFFFAF